MGWRVIPGLFSRGATLCCWLRFSSIGCKGMRLDASESMGKLGGNTVRRFRGGYSRVYIEMISVKRRCYVVDSRPPHRGKTALFALRIMVSLQILRLIFLSFNRSPAFCLSTGYASSINPFDFFSVFTFLNLIIFVKFINSVNRNALITLLLDFCLK